MVQQLAVIIGSQKCGTTSLFNYLAQHPQIAPCKKKEPRFFDRNNYWERGPEWYQDLWNWDSEKHSFGLEASPQYTLTPSLAATVSERMASLGLPTKLIYIMRDPISKIESARSHGYYHKWPSLANVPFEVVPQSLLEGAQYATIVEQYTQRFAQQDLLLLRLEDLKANPQSTLEKTVEFLSLSPFEKFQGLQEVYNARNRYRQDTLWFHLSSIKSLKGVADKLPHELKNNLRQRLNSPMPKKDAVQVPALTDAQKRTILEQLQPELSKLEKSYGVALAGWQISV